MGTSSHSEIVDIARRRGDGHALSSVSLESKRPTKDFIKAAGNHWGFPFQELKTGHQIQPRLQWPAKTSSWGAVRDGTVSRSPV